MFSFLHIVVKSLYHGGKNLTSAWEIWTKDKKLALKCTFVIVYSCEKDQLSKNEDKSLKDELSNLNLVLSNYGKHMRNFP